MKKCISLLLVLCFTISLSCAVPVTVSAETNWDYTYEVSDENEVTITQCSGTASGAIIIPSEMGGYPVTSMVIRHLPCAKN